MPKTTSAYIGAAVMRLMNVLTRVRLVFLVCLLMLLASCEFYRLAEIPIADSSGLPIIMSSSFSDPEDPNWRFSGGEKTWGKYDAWIGEGYLHLLTSPGTDGSTGCMQVATSPDFSATDYSVAFDMKHSSGPLGVTCALKVIELGSLRYALMVNGQTLSLYKQFADGSSDCLLQQMPADGLRAEGEWNRLELQVSENHVQIHVNGTLEYQLQDDDPPRGNGMAVYFMPCSSSGGTVEVLVDNFTLRGE